MAGELGLADTLRDKAIQGYWDYRLRGRERGTIISFEKFIQTRPDGGEPLKNGAGEPLTLDDLFKEMGLNRRKDNLLNLVSRDDDFRFLFGPMLEDPFLKGYLEMPDEQPALWRRLCATEVPTDNEAVKKGYMKSAGQPARTAEGETFPVATLMQSQEVTAWGKYGITLQITEEFLRSNPFPVIETWVVETGRICQEIQNQRAIQALYNGDLASGANACPLIGVTDTDQGMVYRDFNRVWTRGARIGERWFTILSGEEMGNKIGMIDEFKKREAGQPLIVLGNRPEPPEMNRYVTDEVPEQQCLFVDDSHALQYRCFIPPHVSQSEHPENWTKGVVFGWSDWFERLGDRAVVGVDETMLFSEHGFPDWFVVGGTRPWAV